MGGGEGEGVSEGSVVTSVHKAECDRVTGGAGEQ